VQNAGSKQNNNLHLLAINCPECRDSKKPEQNFTKPEMVEAETPVKICTDPDPRHLRPGQEEASHHPPSMSRFQFH
jgi:hypothetical protein